MWFLADVIGLFSIIVVPFSRNVGQSDRILSANVVPKQRMLSFPVIYVIGPLVVGVGFADGQILLMSYRILH